MRRPNLVPGAIQKAHTIRSGATAQVLAAQNTETGLYLRVFGLLAGFAIILFMSLSGMGPAFAQKADAAKTVPLDKLMKAGPLPENVTGAKGAPVTIVEYSSMTCPHCARFHKETLPALRQKYIETGKVRYILREYPLENLAAAASLVARCAGVDKTFPLVDALYATQKKWAFRAANPRDELFEISKQAGFTEKSFDACLKDQQLLDGILEIRRRGNEDYGVRSTPSFFINGQLLEGAQPLEEFEKLMSPYITIAKKGEKSSDKTDGRLDK